MTQLESRQSLPPIYVDACMCVGVGRGRYGIGIIRSCAQRLEIKPLIPRVPLVARRIWLNGLEATLGK